MGQAASMMDGPPNPGGSVMSMSMLRSVDRGALTMLREHTADRLATTVQVRSPGCCERAPMRCDGALLCEHRCVTACMLTTGTGVQQQAGVLVAKDQQIAELEQRVRELEAPQGHSSADENMGSGSADAAQDDGHAWESLPPPESFKEALEQILMLQVRCQSSLRLAVDAHE